MDCKEMEGRKFIYLVDFVIIPVVYKDVVGNCVPITLSSLSLPSVSGLRRKGDARKLPKDCTAEPQLHPCSYKRNSFDGSFLTRTRPSNQTIELSPGEDPAIGTSPKRVRIFHPECMKPSSQSSWRCIGGLRQETLGDIA